MIKKQEQIEKLAKKYYFEDNLYLLALSILIFIAIIFIPLITGFMYFNFQEYDCNLETSEIGCGLMYVYIHGLAIDILIGIIILVLSLGIPELIRDGKLRAQIKAEEAYARGERL